jgi:branched-chain amino acid aminotransferase
LKKQLLKPYRLQLCFNGNFYFEELFRLPFEPVNLCKYEFIPSIIYGDAANYFFFEENWNHLVFKLGLLGIPLPSGFTQKKIYSALQLLVSKNKAFRYNRAEIIVFGNKDKGIYKSDYLIKLRKLEESPFNSSKKGLRIDLLRGVKKNISKFNVLSGFAPYLNTVAGVFCQENNLDEVIIPNEDKNICETSRGAIFFVIKNDIFTPPYTEACATSVMREKTIEALKTLGYNITDDKPIKPSILTECEEILIAGDETCLDWVIALRERRFGNKVYKILSSVLSGMTKKLD